MSIPDLERRVGSVIWVDVKKLVTDNEIYITAYNSHMNKTYTLFHSYSAKQWMIDYSHVEGITSSIVDLAS